MSRTLQFAMAAALGCTVLLQARWADATLISYNDVVSGGINGTVVTAASPLTWTHDINDSLDVTTDLIKTVTLSIVLLDPQEATRASISILTALASSTS